MVKPLYAELRSQLLLFDRWVADPQSERFIILYLVYRIGGTEVQTSSVANCRANDDKWGMANYECIGIDIGKKLSKQS